MKGKQNRKSQRRKDAAVAAQTAEDSANQEALRRRLADAERRQAEATAAMVDVSQQMNMAETVTATLRSEQERVRVIEARQKRELASIQGFTNALRKTMVRPTIISRPGVMRSFSRQKRSKRSWRCGMRGLFNSAEKTSCWLSASSGRWQRNPPNPSDDRAAPVADVRR